MNHELLLNHAQRRSLSFSLTVWGVWWCVQEVASKGRVVEDVVQALRNEEAAKLAAQRDAQAARQRVHQLEVLTPFCLLAPLWCIFPSAMHLTRQLDAVTIACSAASFSSSISGPSLLHACPCNLPTHMVKELLILAKRGQSCLVSACAQSYVLMHTSNYCTHVWLLACYIRP